MQSSACYEHLTYCSDATHASAFDQLNKAMLHELTLRKLNKIKPRNTKEHQVNSPKTPNKRLLNMLKHSFNQPYKVYTKLSRMNLRGVPVQPGIFPMISKRLIKLHRRNRRRRKFIKKSNLFCSYTCNHAYFIFFTFS